MNTELLQKIDELSRQITELAQHHSTMGKRLLALMDELEQLKKEAARADFVAPAAPRQVVVKEVIGPPQSQHQSANAARPQKRSSTFE